LVLLNIVFLSYNVEDQYGKETLFLRFVSF
jgi:hypothetical protein